MLISVSIVGINILRLAGVEIGKWYEKLSLGFLLGNGVFTYILFILNLRGVGYTQMNLALVVLVLIFISWLLSRRVNIQSKTATTTYYFSNIKLFKKILYGTYLYIFLSTLIYGLYTPVRDWDSLVLYDFRAKTFVATGFMNDGIERGYFFGYPLLTSLSHTWLYEFGFANATFVHALYYVTFIIAIRYILSKLFKYTEISETAALLIAITPAILSHAYMTYTNLMYSVNIVIGYLFIALWAKYKKFGYFTLATVFIFLSSWTRINEPFWISGVLVGMGVGIYNHQWFTVASMYAIIDRLQAPWNNFEHKYLSYRQSLAAVAPTYFGFLINGLTISRLLEVFLYVVNNIFSPDKVIYTIFLISLIYWFIAKKIKQWGSLEIILLAVISANIGLTFVGTLIFSVSFDTWREIGNSAQRMSMFMVPLLIIFIMNTLDQFLSDHKARK